MPIFDLHCHFSFKPANSTGHQNKMFPDTDHWSERFKSKKEFSNFAKKDKDVIKSSQLHGNAATKGGFRVMANALYPLERGFTSKFLNKVVATLTGYDAKVLSAIYTRRTSYFQLLENEYRNLLQGQSNSKHSEKGNKYKVVNSYDEIVKARKKDPDTICILNSVEGAHSFEDVLLTRQGRPVNIMAAERRFVRRVGSKRKESYKFWQHIEAIIKNIDTMKSTWEHTPLFVTVGHHYYNHLCGHSMSMTNIVKYVLPQTGGAPNPRGHDTNYFHLGLRPWCFKVIAHLLKRENSRGEPVRRVLIDVKHMSPQARLDYYDIVDQRKQFFNDHIPIMVSHTGISGREDLARTVASSDLDKLSSTEKQASQYFYPGHINLFDCEIERVVASDGIIGLMIDERRIMGKKIPPEAGLSMKEFNDLSKANKELLKKWTDVKNAFAWTTPTDRDEQKHERDLAAIDKERQKLLDPLRPAYMSVILRQIFHVLDLVGKDGWNHLALGTDYDGVINPIDVYPQSADMNSIKKDLVTHWTHVIKNGTDDEKDIYKRHLYSKTPQHWVEKVLWKNGNDFLRKYFNDEFLSKGVAPP